MPCYDGRDVDRIEVIDNTDYTTIGKLESLLCSTCRVLEEYKFDFDKNPRLSEWWAKHKEEDRRREAAQKRKDAMQRLELERVEAAASKRFKDLTKEEKQLLKKHKYI